MKNAAKDVVQEYWVTIYNQAKQNGLQIDLSVRRLFFLTLYGEMVERKIKKFFKGGNNKRRSDNLLMTSIATCWLNLEIEKTKSKWVFDRDGQNLGDACKDLFKNLLTFFFEIKSMDEVGSEIRCYLCLCHAKKEIIVALANWLEWCGCRIIKKPKSLKSWTDLDLELSKAYLDRTLDSKARKGLEARFGRRWIFQGIFLSL